MNIRLLAMTGLVAAALVCGCAGRADEAGSASQDVVANAAPVPAARPATPVQCEAEAFDAARFLDAEGWGEVTEEPLQVISKKRDDANKAEEFAIKSTVSGFTYTVKVLQAPKSEACFVESVVENEPFEVNGKDDNIQCEETALKMATHTDVIGWGEVTGEPLQVVSRKRDEESKAEEFKVRSTVSGFTYTVVILQAPKSEACFLESIVNQ